VFALLAINGNSPDVRVIAVSPTREPLKRFISRNGMLWWSDTGRGTEIPRLTWRIKNGMPWEFDDTEVASFRGMLLGKPITELQIRVVEMTGAMK
jgi:hypothetical protein